MILAYGPPVLGVSMVFFFVQFFFLKFATDVLGMAPALVGLLFAVGRLWDALTDPVVGTWSDRTRLRLGRRRPWMLAAAPFLAATFAMLYAPPRALPEAWLLPWSALALFAFYAAFTAWMVPHQALGAELTPDYHERSRVFGVRHAAFTLGMMAAFGGIQLVNNAADPRGAAMDLVVGALVVVPLACAVPPLLLREREEYRRLAPASPLASLRDVLRNPHARLLLFVQFIEMLGAGVLGVLSPFVLEYVIKRPDLIAALPASFIVCSVASIPLWIRLSRRYGKRDVWVGSMVVFGLSFGAAAFVQEGAFVSIFVLLVIAGVAAGCGGVVGPSILADVIDADEHRSGERKEGAYSAAWGFAIKAGNALVILISGVALQLAGFEPRAAQSAAVDVTLRALFGGLPFVMFLTGAFLFRRFRLDAAAHARIRADLDARAVAERREG
ncbi:MAG: MFS transporter [Myxococcota bacterium]|nr:MFS transporter [Myxococcota bacterium]